MISLRNKKIIFHYVPDIQTDFKTAFLEFDTSIRFHMRRLNLHVHVCPL